MKNQKKAYLLSIILLILSINACKSVSTPQGVILPVLEMKAIERPILSPIPDLEFDLYTELQQKELEGLIKAYNNNLANLLIYTEELEGYVDIQQGYIRDVSDILQDSP